MNHGFAEANQDDWLLFWGSDDWAAGPSVFSDLVSALESSSSHGFLPDLLVCKGRYASACSGALSRSTEFHSSGVISIDAYRRTLFLGSTPPHQATLFGPGARRHLSRYASGFRLSADLDYFLRLTNLPSCAFSVLI